MNSTQSNKSIFEVETIHGKRVRHGKKEFLIHWRGYTAEQNSWEPEKNLIGCQLLVKEFLQRTRTPSPGRKHLKSKVHAQTPKFKDDEGFTKLRIPRTQKSVGGNPEEEFKVLHLKSEPPQSPKRITSSFKVKREAIIHGEEENRKVYQTPKEVAPTEEKPQENKWKYHQVLLGWLMAIAMFVLIMLLVASFIPVVI